MQRGVVGVVVGLAALLFVAASAQAAVSGSTKRNHAEARADAKRQLASFSVPPGSNRVSQDPSAGHTLSPCPPVCDGGEAVVDDSRFWRVPGDPQSVASWVRSHVPAGARVRSSGPEVGYPGTYQVWFSFDAAPGRVVGRLVIVEVAPAKGGGSVLRADSQAKWIVTRPRWDHIPKSARVVTVTFLLEGHPSRPVTFTSRQKLRPIVRSIDQAQVRQPEPAPPCPAETVEAFRLSFRARAGGPVLARAAAYFTCPSDMSLSVRGQHGPLLISPSKLWNILVGIGAVSLCSRGDLTLKSRGVHRSGNERYGALEIVDQNPNTCEIGPGETVALFGRGRRPLDIPVSDRGLSGPFFVTPRVPLGMRVAWRRTCKRDQVARVQLRLQGLSPPLSAPIQDYRRFTPCQATVEFFLGLF
jgi:hypothetical protein